MTNLNHSLPKPNDWHKFLSKSKNKQKLNYLSSDPLLLPNTADKVLYVTKGGHCFQKWKGYNKEIENLTNKK